MAGKRRLHPLDNEKPQERLNELQRYRRQARLAHLDNRQQMTIDADYFDGIQLSDDIISILEDRGQPIQVWNLTKSVINWAIGIEEKSRVDINVLPRRKQDEKDAKTKAKVIKYNADLNYAEYMRSEAFKHAVKVGVGWLDIGASANPDNPLYYGNVDWRDVWFDNLGKRPDLSDWRYLFLERWVDLDIAKVLFEDRAEELENAAQDTNSRYPYNPEDSFVFDDATDGVSSDYGMTFGQTIEGYRNRVKIVHMQYRMPDNVKILNVKGEEYGAVDKVIYRPDDELHGHLVKYGYASLEDARRMTMRHAFWCNSIYLRDYATPYNHNRFSLVPIFCYRRDRDGMPYGMIRDLRSPQDDVNARKARAFFLMSTEKVVYEDGAIPGDIWAFKNEYDKPDGIPRVGNGAISQGKIKFIDGAALAEKHLEVGRDAERFMHNISGITPEQQGQSERDLSGVAIKALQSQGATTNSSAFQNYYFALQLAGEIELSNIEQFYNTQKTIRITGDQQQHEFVTLNGSNDRGEAVDSITRFKADFKISKSDYRETIRQGNLATIGEMINSLLKVGGKGQEAAIAMLDVFVDLHDDLPFKDELLRRVRQVTGQEGVDEDLSPEERQEKQQQKQAQMLEMQKQKQIQDRMIQLELRIKAAEAASKEGRATKDHTEALVKQLEGFIKALEAAGMVQVAPQLVQAADALIEEAKSIGGGNVTISTNE